jgi:putative heme-binding domain-containing protein
MISSSILQRLTLQQLTLVVLLGGVAPLQAADLSERLLTQKPDVLAAQATMRGDPIRGSIVFHTSAAGCIKCHSDGSTPSPLGPKLTDIPRDTPAAELVNSVLRPSQKIRKGYETVTILTTDGVVKNGMLVRQDEQQVELRELRDLLHPTIIPADEIDEIEETAVSMMPAGLVNSLLSERDFFDLLRYLIEVVQGGPDRATALRPAAEDLIVKDDTVGLDHAGILRGLTERDLKAGRAIYLSHCKNCHGTDGNEPTLPLARAFGREPFKNGDDPYRMLQTLTKGNGLMAAVQHLSPKERYQVIHYIRESLMKPTNPAYTPVDEAYLAGLPKGTGQGNRDEVGPRDFGPALGSQIGTKVNNALTIRLNDDTTAAYDLHQMRMVGVWKDGFLDLSQTQHYRQRGEKMPEITGSLLPGLDGWQWAIGGSFALPPGGKPPRGPLADELMHFSGYSLYGNAVILRYAIEGRKILESPTCRQTPVGDAIEHTLQIGPGPEPLKLCVARLPETHGASGVYPLQGSSTPKPHGPAADHAAALMAAGQPEIRHLVRGEQAEILDLGTPGRTIVVHFRTTGSGTLIASAPEEGRWEPNGKTLFIDGDELVFDIGWVGAIREKAAVRDGAWHTAAVVVTAETTKLFLDGTLLGQRNQFHRPPVAGQVLKLGETATNFGGNFTGDLAWAKIYNTAMSPEMLAKHPAGKLDDLARPLFEWHASATTAATVSPEVAVAAHADGDIEGCAWEVQPDGRMVLTIPAASTSRSIRLAVLSTSQTPLADLFQAFSEGPSTPLPDLITQLQGGPRRWPETITVKGRLGASINGYALDTIPVPFDNPWNAWLRTSAVDFFPDGRAVVTTHGGDVYLVTGIDDVLDHVVWQRYAAGLFEPFGVRVVEGLIYVTCRDGIKRLHDENGDGEADFIEAFWNDDDVSCMFHAYNFDLQTDDLGNFYFAKAGQYTQHHRPGTIMKIPPEGGRAEVVAWGLRTPNGMGRLADGRFTVSDNQGPWMPAGKISAIEPGGFYGNMPTTPEQDRWLKDHNGGELPDHFDEPFIWMPQELDNSCGGQVWVDDPRFGPLAGRLLHASFGKGWLYSLSLQEVGDQTQAAIMSLPHQWEAGVMRLRVNPADGQVYGVGLSGWQGPAGGKDGCFQRLRYTGKPCRMIDSVHVTPTGLRLVFSFPVDSQTVAQRENWKAEMWNYHWSKRYGSDQFSVLEPDRKGRDSLSLTAAVSGEDKKTVDLTIPNLRVCDQVFLSLNLRDQSGEPFTEQIYLTVHAIPAETAK